MCKSYCLICRWPPSGSTHTSVLIRGDATHAHHAKLLAHGTSLTKFATNHIKLDQKKWKSILESKSFCPESLFFTSTLEYNHFLTWKNYQMVNRVFFFYIPLSNRTCNINLIETNSQRPTWPDEKFAKSREKLKTSERKANRGNFQDTSLGMAVTIKTESAMNWKWRFCCRR